MRLIRNSPRTRAYGWCSLYRSVVARSTALALFALVGACKSDPVTPATTQSIVLTAAALTMDVPQGANGTITISLQRLGGFTGSVNVAATGLPAGVTATFAPSALPAGVTSSTLNLAVGSAAVPGNSTFTVRASGSGVKDTTLTIALNITPAQRFSLSFASAAATVPVGGTSTLTADITRFGGFSGTVNLAVSGLPTGITAIVNPTAATGATAIISLTVASTVAAGTYTGSLNGTAAGLTAASAPFSVSVTSVSVSTIRWEYCDPTRIPMFFAFRDGATGAWTRVPQSGNAFIFPISQSVGGIAYVHPLGSGFLTTIRLLTRDDLIATAALECGLFLRSGKTVTGLLSGLNATRSAIVTLGTAIALPTVGSPAFTLTDVPNGSPDLVATRFALNAAEYTNDVDKIVLRRSLNQAHGSVLAPIDFDGSEAFSPVTANVTINNAGSDILSVQSSFNLFLATMSPLSPGITGPTNTRRIYGVPAARMLPNDLHLITTTSFDASGGSRTLTSFIRQIADQTFTLPARLDAPTITTTSTNGVLRPRGRGNFQADYQNQYGFVFSSENRSVVISSTRAYFESANQYDLEVPDLIPVSGFNPAWGLIPGAPVTYSFGADNLPAGPLAVGMRVHLASRIGNVP